MIDQTDEGGIDVRDSGNDVRIRRNMITNAGIDGIALGSC